MHIPIYNYIMIKFDHKSAVFEQLNSLRFGKMPYLFDVTNVEDEQAAITFIDDFIDQYNVSIFPYPVYIISNFLHCSKRLETFSSIFECPQFFNLTVRNISKNEQILLDRLELKIEKLKQIKDSNYFQNINEYAKEHKEIYQLTRESIFFEKILQKLENKK